MRNRQNVYLCAHTPLTLRGCRRMRAGYARSWSHNKFSQFGVCTHGITTPWPKAQTSIPSAKFDCPVTRQGKWLITEIMCVWYGSYVCSADREYLESDPRSYEATKEDEKKALFIIVYHCLSLTRVTLPNNNTLGPTSNNPATWHLSLLLIYWPSILLNIE